MDVRFEAYVGAGLVMHSSACMLGASINKNVGSKGEIDFSSVKIYILSVANVMLHCD